VLVRPTEAPREWNQQPFELTRSTDGWTMIPLQAGTWEVALRYGNGR